jgi:hypothetical protein
LKRYPNDAVVKSYFHDRLQAGDQHALNDLGFEGLWDKTFIKAIVRLLESDYYKYGYALTVLHEHRVDWEGDKALARQLSTVVRKTYPELDRKDINFPHVRDAIGALALTSDREMVRLLSPALEDKRMIRRPYDGLQDSNPNPRPKEPLRICDLVLDSILTILDGEPDDAYAKAGASEILAKDENTEAEWTALRDRMISDLKLRLKGDKKDSPRPAPSPLKQK